MTLILFMEVDGMPIQSISQNDRVYSLIKKGLDASALRSKVSANNIANINTKGFKKSYVTFEESLKDNMDNMAMKTTENKHIQDGSSYGDVKVHQDESTSMRQDGNNVDIDVEMANQAANNLMYNALITQANMKFAMEKYVLDGK